MIRRLPRASVWRPGSGSWRSWRSLRRNEDDEPLASDPGPELIEQAYMALVAGAEVIEPPDPVEVTGARSRPESRLAVEDVAVACACSALLAASTLHRQRGGSHDRPRLDRRHVMAAMRSERYFSRDGQPAGAGFAPLSRFWRTSDGWVRTHAN